MPHALIIDDDIATSAELARQIEGAGFTTQRLGTLSDAYRALMCAPTDLILTNATLPDGYGTELFGACKKHAGTEIVFVAQDARIEEAVDVLRMGASDYLSKPVSSARLQVILDRVSANANTPAPCVGKAALTKSIDKFGAILGASQPMQTLYEHISRVAPTQATVLLLGESGTGKELVSQTIHELSERRKRPFLPLNCGAISQQLIESEIFGHEKGSFTGADRLHRGYFERANGGTLFLDEITEMPVELQVKLLRVLETGAFVRIGSNQEIFSDVRVIAASNRDPLQAVAEGRLRLDLYHRLNVFPLALPPLRERGNDVTLLAQHFLDELNAAHGTHKQLSPDGLNGLTGYAWPGNVRELRNFIQRAFILADDVLDTSDLVPVVSTPKAPQNMLAISLGTSLADVDRRLIYATLDMCGGVKKRAAEILGISLKTLYNRLDEYGPREIPPPVRHDFNRRDAH